MQENILNNQYSWITKLEIRSGTTALTKDGQALTEISIVPGTASPSPPSGEEIVGFAVDFGPGGATFSTPIAVTFEYDPALLPPGITTGNLTLAYFDTQTGKWVHCNCTVDMANHLVTGYLSHFTLFAILAKSTHGIGWGLTGLLIFGEVALGAVMILTILFLRRKRQIAVADAGKPVPMSGLTGLKIAERSEVVDTSSEKATTKEIMAGAGLSKIRLEIIGGRIVLDQDDNITQNVEVFRGKPPLPRVIMLLWG